MHARYPLFQSHLDLAHAYWDKLIRPGHIVIDATCGNGHDTLKLCLCVSPTGQETGKVFAFD
ncbi:MAG: rRNA methyltransferase, partial [Parachlamydia sp.]|nr:rRNA methyltransferase [Parachlamydia sp.]